MFKPLVDGQAVDTAVVEDEMARLELAVDMFAKAMKEKLASKVIQGWSGWDDPASMEAIYNNLLAHAAGVPLARGEEVDVANFALFLWWARVRA